MTDKDKMLIEKARKISYTEWGYIDAMIEEADTEEAKQILHSIQGYKYHTEEYMNGDDIWIKI